MAKIDLILELITNEAQKNLNDFKVKVRSIGDEKIKLNTSADALDAAKKISSAFDSAKKNAGDTLSVTRNVVASLALAGKSGTKEFADAKKQLSLAKKEAQEFEKALKKADPTGLGDKFKTLTSGLGGLGIATAAGFGINELIGSFTAFDTATQKIKTLGGEAANLAPQFKTIALEMSKNFPIAAGEIQDSIYEALSAGIDASEQSIKAFSDSAAKLSVGGGETMKNSVNILSSVLNAYGASAQEAAKYSDILFNTVNLGKTTIPELNQSLSQVVPTAASLELPLDNIGASLALMTANGVPTAQATTKLNQLLVEMIKPGTEFAAVMQKAGVSLETLKTEGLPTTVEKLKTAMSDMGKTSGAVFGSTEASAAFAVLSKDVGKFKEAFEGVANTTGSTEKAFEYMQESVTNQFEQIKAKIESTFLSIADALLPAISDGLDVFAGAIDAVSSILKDYGGLILGVTAGIVAYNLAMKAKDGVSSFIGGINDSILAAKNKITALKEGIATEVAMQATQKATAVGMATTSVAVKGSTLAFQGLKAAFLSNPFGLILTAVTALIPAISWLSDVLTESTEEKLENAKAAEELTKKQIEETKATLTATEQKKKLVDEYIKLAENAKRTAEEQTRFEALQKQITEKYPELISKTGDFTTSLSSLKEESYKTASQIETLNGSLISLGEKGLKLKIQTMGLELDVSSKKLTETIGDAYSGDAETAMLEIVKKYTDAIKNAKTKQEAENISNELADIVSGTKSSLLKALENPELNRTLFNRYGIKWKEVFTDIVKSWDGSSGDMLKASNEVAKITESRLSQLDAEVQKGLIARETIANKIKQANDTEVKSEQTKEKEKEKASTKTYEKRKNDALDLIELEKERQLRVFENSEKEKEIERASKGIAKTKQDEKQTLVSELAIYQQILGLLASKKPEFKTDEELKSYNEYYKELQENIEDLNYDIQGIDAKINFDDSEAKKKLLELSKEELEWKLEIATNTGDIQKVTELKEALLELQNSDLTGLFLRLQFAGNEVAKKELELQIAKLQADINSKKIEIGIDYQKLDLEGITDIYEYQFKTGLLEAKLAYEKDLELAQGNIAKKTEAERKFQEERNRLQNEYLEKSLKFSDTLTLASRKFGQTLLENFTKDMNPVQDAISKLQEQLQNLGKVETDYSSQEKALNESLKNREISVKEYYAKLRELDQKREAETEGRSKTELKIRSGVSSALYEVQKIYDDKITKELDKISKGQKNTYGDLFQFTAASAVSSFASMLAAGVEFGEAFRKGILGTILQTAQQAILVNIPLIYSTFFGYLGPWGWAAATGAIALVYAGLEAAKSAIGLKAGAVDLAGPGTSTSDSIAAKLSRGESVITADGTKQNKELLKWINRTGRPAYEYFQNINYNNRSSNQGGVSSQDFDKLSSEVRGMRQQIEILNRRKSTLNAVDVNVKIDDKKLLKLVEMDKLAALRRM